MINEITEKVTPFVGMRVIVVGGIGSALNHSLGRIVGETKASWKVKIAERNGKDVTALYHKSNLFLRGRGA